MCVQQLVNQFNMKTLCAVTEGPRMEGLVGWLGQWGHNEIFYLNLTEYLGNSLLHSFWLILIIMLKQKQNICYCYFIAHTFIN